MRRNCGKLGLLVGTLPTKSSSLSSSAGACNSCSFARTVSTGGGGAHLNSATPINSESHNANCQCSPPESSGPTTFNWRPISSNSSATSTSLFNFSRKCSTICSRIESDSSPFYSSRRHYCSDPKKYYGNFTGMRMLDTSSSSPSLASSHSSSSSSSSPLQSNSRHHLQNNDNNNNNSKAQSSFSSSSTENNTQILWSSHHQTSAIDYCSIIGNKSKENGNHQPSSSLPPPPKISSSSSVVCARSLNSCGNSISTGPNGPSSASASASTSSSTVSSMVSASPIFGINTATSSAAGTSTSFTSIRTVVTSQRLVEVTRDSIMEQPKLMSKEEREEFMSVYHQLVKELVETPDTKDMEETVRWMSRVLQYNVPHGKKNRGLSTALAYKYLAPEELTEENVRLSYVLGWCVEILQAFFLVSDDIMDESETRRGRPCWYKVDNLGLAAVNDAILLEATIYAILRKHFNNKPYYAKVMEVMHDVTLKTILGQSLDTRTGQDRRMETYTMDRYSSIVKYKTSYYSFYLPVALAMAMCEITDPNLFQQMRKVTLEMGHFFQIQDDYLDCFGDEEVTGKIGTDIQDCKCSWLFVVAMQMCNPEQKKFLLDNYGKHNPDNIAAVKKIYKELGMEDVYNNYEEQTYNMICTHIQQMSEQLPKGLFYDMLHKIYKRSS